MEPATPTVPTVPTIQSIHIFHCNEPQLPDLDAFCGRAYERSELIQRVSIRASTAVDGPYRIGKSWLLQYLQQVAPIHSLLGSHVRIGRFSATHPQCQTLAGFVKRALDALNLPNHDGTQAKRPPLVQLALAARDCQKLGIIPVLCIDEFAGLIGKPDFDSMFLNELRSIAEDDGLVLITASKQPLHEVIEQMTGQTSPLFNIMPRLPLNPFTKLEAQALIDKKGQQAGFDQQERAFFLECAAISTPEGIKGWPPLRLQLVGKMLHDEKRAAVAEQRAYAVSNATYNDSRVTSTKGFDYLHRCSLYWDERVYLPLPYLKRTLLIAYDESPQKALEEIAFINAERPQQARAARAAVLEIVVRDLEQCNNLEKMAAVANWLTALLPPEMKLVDPRGNTAIARLSDASRDAMRAIAPIGLQGRRKALDDCQANLRKVYPNAFRNQRLNARLAQVVRQWQEIARQKQEELSRAAQDVGNIDNPYKPGQHLSLKDSLFEGRGDLAKELEGALSLGGRRPTFLLNGERRMGKTSALKQLPNLLGSRYISVFYNLQGSGIYASTESFLGTLASGIQREMNTRAMPVEPLQFGIFQENPIFQETRRASSPTVYRLFERWLDGVETVLEREQCILLLTFDEMGKLAELDWTSYFINVQMLRVSFLRPEEARRLITKPTPRFPGETIFPSDVVDAIIAATGCHPFLVQAVCSALITLLNVERREQATLADVSTAVEKVLEGWESHFANLWNRTDDAQRACLEALLTEQRAGQLQLTQRTGLDEKTVRHAVQTLLRRDLISREQDGSYRIAVPMFRQWMEQNV